MSPNSATDSITGFIEFNRTFHELSENDAEDGFATYSRIYGSNRLCWPDLLKEYRVVILSEAGTGKTAEIRNIARTLRVQGRPAFFLRLEHIPQDFEDAFEIGAYENFEEWLASAEEGWLLLDSVDEARLRHPLDFELAIRKLGRRIQSAKDRTHIVITGRTTAWRPKTDLAHCKRHLSYGSSAQTKRDPQAEDDNHEGVVHTQTVTAGQAQSDFRIVAFDDLTREQIAVFVEARGIKNSKSFLDAVERADAWAFTSRPQDLEELTGFWIDKGRIGTRLELIRNSIDRRLAERDQDRADGRPLSAERVRQGTRLLAASTTLTKDSTIRVPDGSDNTKGIAVQSVLTEWDDQEISTLLSRPIFDEAIYGTVRFHHGSVREYLTAEWFAELLKRETSRRTIETEILANKREERLTDYRQASVFGSLWHFNKDDFEYVAGEISRQTFLDNRLVALSVALTLYEAANHPRAWRVKLEKLTSDNYELSTRLNISLRPPAQGEDSRKWEQQEIEWERVREAQKKGQDQYHEGWRRYLSDNLEKDRTAHYEEPWTVPNSVFYLFEQIRDKNNQSGRWAEYNWQTIIPEYGEDVARFYRDITVSCWRHHDPELRSEGAPFNTTSYAVIIGLIGLEIEAHETKDWPKNLNLVEVERACRYASFELNGFPTWFPTLFETYPRTVADFLMQEIEFELSIGKPETAQHYILSDLSWSGQWAWDELAPSICDLLKREPKNLSSLEGLLKILQGSSLPDNLIEKLASRKCRTLKKHDHLARWYAVWTGVAPDDAISSLEARAREIDSSEEQTSFAMTYLTHLLGGLGTDEAAVRQGFKTPENLKLLYLLMHEYIRPEDDINRIGKGAYSPGLRDYAQRARDSLFSLLNQIPGKKSFLAMLDIAKSHPTEASRSWLIRQVNNKAEQEGDIEPWLPSQVKDFHEMLERTPGNHRELAELAILRLLDLKDDLECGDSSIASILKTVTQETEIRKYIGREFREKALERYSIPQEEELADAKRPDLRFHGVGFDAPVPVELKLADKWSGPALFERLENQLCADYLRDNRSSRGVFLLVFQGSKAHWDLPGSNDRVDFKALIAALQNHWERISPKFPNVDDIKVVGIDLTERAR